MNYSNDTDLGYNANSISHKKRVHGPFDDGEVSFLGLPRKRFISEESVARDMAAMSLNSINANQTLSQPQPYYFNPVCPQQLNSLPQEGHRNNNVVIIDDINKFLSDEEGEQIDIDPHMIHRDANGRTLVEDLEGLPLEVKPGESKPRVPDFVLKNTELTDPRDISAYQSILKSMSKGNRTTHIEVLNDPIMHYDSASMDID